MLSSLPTTPEQCEAMAWGSHLPALLAAIGETGGAVLELGIGHFSTPHLHALCGAMHRKLVSVEDNPEWYQSFVKYQSDGHKVIWTSSYPVVLLELAKSRWSVVFIDHSPGGASRANAFSALISCSEFVVVHDYHLENEDAIKPLLEGVSHYVTKTYDPPTLVASKVRDIPGSIYRL